jgi:hypothetical protein
MPATLPRVAPDIGPILALVRKTRRLLRSSWGAIGVGVTLGLAFAALAAVTIADILVPLVGPWLRLIGLILFVVPTAVVFVWKGVLPLSRRLRNVEVARRIESKIPGMHSRLVSCMDLAGRYKDVSPAFYRKLVDESLDRIGQYRPTAVVDFTAVRKAIVTAIVGVGLFAILWIALGNRLTTALARVFNPFADLPPASDVAYTVEPGTTKLLTGEDVTFAVHVTDGEPESLMVELTGENAGVHYPLEKDADGVWRRTLRGLSAERGFEKGFTYRVFGGRIWTRQNRIDWTGRPVIVDTNVRVHFPEYMGIPDPLRLSPKDRNVVGPAGSEVEVVVTAEGDVAEGVIQLLKGKELSVAATYPLNVVGDRTWTGSFPLTGSGRYRVELRNELGHANKPASEDPRFEALTDQPPTVHLKRPSSDLVLSKADKVPLQITARDDYGLLDLWLAVQSDGESSFTRTTKLKDYPIPNPQKVDTVVASLDLTASGLDLKAGKTLRYRVEVRDRRPNSGPVISKDFSVRVAEDPNAADKVLDRFEKGQDAIRQKLSNLVTEQRKIKEKIDRADARHSAAKNDAQQTAQIRKEVTDLHTQEQKNVAAATQLDQELKTLAANAQKASLLNGEISKQVHDLSNQFKSAAVDPLQDLSNKLQQAANPTAPPPDLKDAKTRSDRVQKNLESLKDRMDAIADAQKALKSDPEKALAKLKEDMLKEQGKSSARTLEELKETLKSLRDELGKHQMNQQDLADKTEQAPDKDIPDFEGKQTSLDKVLQRDLDLAKKLLDQEKARRMQQPDLVGKPAQPKERKSVPKEDDSPDGDPTKKGDAKKPDIKPGPEDDLFKPALKGEREKLDPRFDKKMRMPPKKKDGRRDELQEHQQDNLRDLDAAQKGLKSDEQTLEEMIQSLMNASQKSEATDAKGPNNKGPTDKLTDLLRSEAMKDAMKMAQRAKQNGKDGQSQSGPSQPPTGTASDSIMGNSIGAAGIPEDLDPKTRATILQLPPRVREELLQGMKAQGPEGYQKFIQDYFRRLSAVPK